jgi:hypothetical protein
MTRADLGTRRSASGIGEQRSLRVRGHAAFSQTPAYAMIGKVPVKKALSPNGVVTPVPRSTVL